LPKQHFLPLLQGAQIIILKFLRLSRLWLSDTPLSDRRDRGHGPFTAQAQAHRGL